ncbi:MAG TPA: hypothetical protein VHK90_00085 [Thermoanaerobaculia bacterium]|nr:hypothetical protein [Thermoanaerobaculia bacterium]
MLRAAEVAWYVTGRFYESAVDSSVFDAGFFLHLPIVGGDLDDRFTFLAKPFTPSVRWNGDLKISIDPVGEFSVFYDEQRRATFDDPLSFGSGLCIATFRRVSIVASAFSMNVLSAELIASTPFEHRGRCYDFAELLPYGVTQWGTASTTSGDPPPTGYTSAVPFVGSAIVV